MSVTILIGDARKLLRNLPDASVQCCVTSPPYFGLRDYGVDGQMGLEARPDEFVAGMVALFREVRRVLRDDGTLWLNLGDSYNNRTRIRTSSRKPIGVGERKTWAQSAADGEVRMTITQGGLKEKDLLGVPWQLAAALRYDGWYLRQEIIWAKPVGKLDVAGDRFPVHHEPIFMFAKSKWYYFDASALPEWARGTVWSVPALGFEGHGAAFPPALIKPMILAGSRSGDSVLDPFGGAGTTGLVADRLGRNATLIELNPEYAALAERRIRSDAGMFSEVKAA